MNNEKLTANTRVAPRTFPVVTLLALEGSVGGWEATLLASEGSVGGWEATLLASEGSVGGWEVLAES